MLFQAPALDDQEQEVLGRIDQLRRALSYATAARRWTGVLRRMTFARGLQGSNSIEGYRVSADDAVAAAAAEAPLEAEGETWKALVGYRTAMTYVLQLADDPHVVFSNDLVRALHFMMLSHDLAKHPGRWRPGPIFVRNDETGERVYEGPDAGLVNDLAAELMTWLNEGSADVHPIVAAAMAHINLVMIHPFSDGNGRMSRALQTLVLARHGVLAPVFSSIEEYLGRYQQEYYRMLAAVGSASWAPGRDARPWVRFCLTAHLRQAATLGRRARVMQRVWEGVEFDVERQGLPDRVVGVLAEAALGLKVRNATYRALAGITENLASRDLKGLADAGWLIAVGERRGRVYVASDDLRKRGDIAASGESANEPDPFAPPLGQ